MMIVNVLAGIFKALAIFTQDTTKLTSTKEHKHLIFEWNIHFLPSKIPPNRQNHQQAFPIFLTIKAYYHNS